MRQTRTSYLIVALIGLAACDNHSPTLPTINAAATSSDVTVSAAVPDSATQDTTLDVTISGSGFAAGAEAQWGQGGTPSANVRTNSTRFVNSRKLIANITIAVDAATGLYDVIVTNLSGKKGIGTELFAVKQKATDTPIVAIYRNAASDGLSSDGLAYVDGVDAVSALILAFGNYRVLTVDASPRAFCFAFHGQDIGGVLPDAFCDQGYQPTGNPSVPGGFPALAPGSSMTTRSQVYWSMNGYGWFLRFGRDCNEIEVPANHATVTRSADGTTWTFESGGAAHLCRAPLRGRPGMEFVATVVMPFAVTVQLKP